MKLENLNQLAISARKEYRNYNHKEVVLSSAFKKNFEDLIQSRNETIEYFRFSAKITTSSNLTITFPNQWFFIASYFTDFLIALKAYKAVYAKIFGNISDAKNVIQEIKGAKVIPPRINKLITEHLDDPKDIENFQNFISNYTWWNGNKTIDRADYFVSPILNLAGVVNVSQAFIAELTNYLCEEPTLAELLKAERNESDQMQYPNWPWNDFYKALINLNLRFHENFCLRFISSLQTKKFVILTGLSGSGKTKLAQAFVKWICETKSQYMVIPIGADWTNREPLLGYPNALEKNQYMIPESSALSLMLEAAKPENQSKPYFLILDEMNLSHVERYFADFLSAMESGERISLHSGNEIWGDVPPAIELPKNLFIIGTVNIDETTYMFSPKVLDRANVIEFRVTAREMETYLSGITTLNIDELNAQGAGMAASFVALANDNSLQPNNTKELREELLKFFTELKKTGAEFGYRSASEIYRFAAVVNRLDPSWELSQIIDAAIMQKLLPKVHGSRRKLEPVLIALGGLCLNNPDDFENYVKSGVASSAVKYPVSLEKILRMYHALRHNGFTSYAEA